MSNAVLEKPHGSQWCSINKFRFSSQALVELKKKLGFTQTLRSIGILSIKQLMCSSMAILQRSYSLLMKEIYRRSLWRNGIWETSGQSSQDNPDCYEHIHPLLTSHHGEPAHSIPVCYKFPTKSLFSCYLWFPQSLERALLKAYLFFTQPSCSACSLIPSPLKIELKLIWK